MAITTLDPKTALVVVDLQKGIAGPGRAPAEGLSMATRTELVIGTDIPWVASWSEEPLTVVGPCPSVDGAIAVGQAENPGKGVPQFNRNHLFRQRRSVIRSRLR